MPRGTLGEGGRTRHSGLQGGRLGEEETPQGLSFSACLLDLFAGNWTAVSRSGYGWPELSGLPLQTDPGFQMFLLLS